MQAGDRRDQRDPAVPELHGFASRHPASLLLVEPIEQGVELTMILDNRRIEPVPTHLARTFVT